MIKAAVLTISDSCSQGERQDQSGPAIRDMLLAQNIEVPDPTIVPDDHDLIAQELKRLSDDTDVNVILTTGGTGLGPRDVTPEATLSVCQRLVPGLMETTRAHGYKKTQNAILSRGVAGTRNDTLIVNLPGSLKAVKESMQIILPLINHAIKMIKGGGH